MPPRSGFGLARLPAELQPSNTITTTVPGTGAAQAAAILGLAQTLDRWEKAVFFDDVPKIRDRGGGGKRERKLLCRISRKIR